MRECGLILRFAATVLLTTFAQIAQATPFCVESQGIPRECFYYDITQCKQAAAQRNGFCLVNTEVVKPPEHGAAYCLIDAGMKPECHFPDGETCNHAARARNAVCFENVQAMSPDPYRLDRPLFKNGQ